VAARPVLTIGKPVQASLGAPLAKAPATPSPAQAVIAPPAPATLSAPAASAPAASASTAATALAPALPVPAPFRRTALDAQSSALAFASPGAAQKTVAAGSLITTPPPASALPGVAVAEPAPAGPQSALVPAGKEEIGQLVAKHAAANGLPFELAHGVVMVESRYNPKVTGPGGHVGLMQISYPTAKSLGYAGSRAGLYDPDVNLAYGMKYLGMAYKASGGDMCGAISKYQGGHRTVGITRAGAAYCGKVRKMVAAGPARAAQPRPAAVKKTASAN
jgi:soluble lytic murein transglycosylase-like protein